MARTVRNYVGGEWVESQSSRTQDVTNPATGEVLACVPLSTAEEAGAAVAAAHAAFDEWQHTPALDRARLLFGLKELLERDFADIAIFDPTATATISAATHHHHVDRSIYEGFPLTGTVRQTLVAGRLQWNDGDLRVERGAGRYLPRTLS